MTPLAGTDAEILYSRRLALEYHCPYRVALFAILMSRAVLDCYRWNEDGRMVPLVVRRCSECGKLLPPYHKGSACVEC